MAPRWDAKALKPAGDGGTTWTRLTDGEGSHGLPSVMLGRIGVEAKAPAPTVLATGRLDLVVAAGGNGSPIHPQIPGRLILRGKAERLLLGTSIVDTRGLYWLGSLPGAAPPVRIGVVGMAYLFGFAAPLEIVHVIVAAVPVFVIG